MINSDERKFVQIMLDNNSKFLLNITDEKKARLTLASFLWATIGFMHLQNATQNNDIRNNA